MELKRIDTGNALILLAPISAVGYGIDSLNESDKEYIAGFSSDKRKAEVSAWRAAVRREGIYGDIVYSKTRTPLLSEGEKWSYIGVSHTDDMAAVILSRCACAIDIERTDRDFRKAASRFISLDEQNIAGSDSPFFTVAVWCAKETLYKFSGRKELDLIRDLRIYGIDWFYGTISGAVRCENMEFRGYTIRMFLHEGYIIVYMVAGKHD